jgi:hypothetical protein
MRYICCLLLSIAFGVHATDARDTFDWRKSLRPQSDAVRLRDEPGSVGRDHANRQILALNSLRALQAAQSE